MLAHESAMARMERIIHRLWALVIIIFVALIITNGAWIYYESQFEVVEETTEEVVTQDVRATGNSDAVVAGIGDAFNGGKSEANRKTEDDKTVSQKEEIKDD